MGRIYYEGDYEVATWSQHCEWTPTRAKSAESSESSFRTILVTYIIVLQGWLVHWPLHGPFLLAANVIYHLHTH
jgi:hypothetical protein